MDIDRFYRNYWLLCGAGVAFLCGHALGLVQWHCPVHALGLPCMGCGITRGLLALSRGQWHEALAQNALAFPLAAAWLASIIVAVYDRFTGRETLMNLYTKICK